MTKVLSRSITLTSCIALAVACTSGKTPDSRETESAPAATAAAGGAPGAAGAEHAGGVKGEGAPRGGADGEARGAGGEAGWGSVNVCEHETRTVDYAPDLMSAGRNGLAVTLVSSVPGPPVVGDNVWLLQIADEAGSPIVGAEVTVVPFMPDHRHGSPLDVVVTELGDGQYRAQPLNFSMPGYWNTRVEVVSDLGKDVAAFKLCIAGL